MSTTDQLSWERRLAPYAAAAAFLAVVLQIASIAVQAPAQEDAPESGDPDRHFVSLVNLDENAGAVMASAVLQALAIAATAFALYYLFRATRARRAELPGLLRYLLVIAPVLLLVGSVIDRMNTTDIADRFVANPALAAPTPERVKDATAECREQRRDDPSDFREDYRTPERCVEIEVKDQAAEDFIEDERSFLGGSLALAGGLAMGFAFVLVSLHAMRAGLLSRFMGILGIIAGVLQVLPLSPVPVVQVFWLGALVALFLGRWPGGGRGPAWESGEAEPWPSMADQREDAVGQAVRKQFEPPDDANGGEQEPEDGADEPEPGPDHPVSKKRKRKRRR